MSSLRIFLIAAVLATATTASARTEWIVESDLKQDRPMQVDVMFFIWPFGKNTWLGGAGWFGLPILDDGFIPFNDSLYVEAGGYVALFEGQHQYFALVPAGGVRWNLHLTKSATVFLTAKLLFRIGFTDVADINKPGFSGTVGGYWHISDKLYLRFEAGNFGVIQAGISMPL